MKFDFPVLKLCERCHTFNVNRKRRCVYCDLQQQQNSLCQGTSYLSPIRKAWNQLSFRFVCDLV